MRALDFKAINAVEFPELTNLGVPFVQDGEFAVGIKFNSRETVVMAIRNYTISKGLDYKLFEPELLTFYVKCL
ncbi:hypothetical protein AHAS_Ahas11G0152100 [Arachis hypogaea]